MAFSFERENRLQIFKNVYQTLKDIRDCIPPNSIEINLLQQVTPVLERTVEFLQVHSPSVNLLKFLDYILKDTKQASEEQ